MDTLFRCALHFTRYQWLSIDGTTVAEDAIEWLNGHPPPVDGYWADFYKTLEKVDRTLALRVYLGK
jgi:hypothetical protein